MSEETLDHDAKPGRASGDVPTATVDHGGTVDHGAGRATVSGGPLGPGVVIGGRYVLVEKLGEGGMGEVWTADQTEPVKRKVALKLVKTGMDSAAVLARFEAERQALALMDHPGIARVLDGGLTPHGQPFFVMELVQGQTLTKFCEERGLTTRQRLELFVPICQAVQHAHSKGIVHRDLKPANILVSLIDGKAVPRVIDFGVAKATGGELGDLGGQTQAGGVIGTLEYMSPEQAGGLDVDTRTDVYALGVVLYELLAGKRPFDPERFRRTGLAQALRIIQEEEPPRPSSRAGAGGAALAAELDWVVMRCLEKSRERRYETASALADDVRRHLADEPVEARPPSWGYRAGKFVARNRVLVTAASLVLLALLLGLGGTAWGLIHAEEQRKEAVKAQKEEEKRVKERDDALGKLKISEAEAKLEARRAKDARHGTQVEQVLAAWEAGNVPLAMTRINGMAPESLDGWETIHLRNLCLRHALPAEEYPGHEGAALAIAAGPGGRFVSTGRDKSAIVRDTGKRLVLKGHAGPVVGVSMNRAGTRVLTASEDKSLRLWDAAKGTEIRSYPGVRGCLSPDGERLLAVGPDGTFLLRDSATGDEVRAFKGPPATLAWFSPDGKRVLAAHADRTLRLWDTETAKEQAVLTGHGQPVTGAAFSPDGARIVSSAGTAAAKGKPRPGEVKVWDARTGQEKASFAGHPKGVAGVAFSPDGTLIASGGLEGVALVREAASGKVRLTLVGHHVAVHGIAFSPDGTRLLCATESGTIQAWDVAIGQEELALKGHEGEVYAVCVSPDGSRIASAGSDRMVKVWDARTGRELLTLDGHRHGVRSVAWSRDGNRIATGSFDKTARLWDAATGKELRKLEGDAPGGGVCFSPDGRTLYTAWSDGRGVGKWIAWEVATGKKLRTFQGHPGGMQHLACSPDGKRLVTGGFDRTALVWDAETGKVLHELKGHPDSVTAACFRLDGRQVMTASGRPGRAGEVRLWDAGTGEEKGRIEGHLAYIQAVAESPDRTRLVTAGREGTLKVWDAETLQEKLTLKGLGHSGNGVCFTPDGRRILGCGGGGLIKRWSAETGRELAVFKGHAKAELGVCLSPDGTRVLGCGDDGRVRVRGRETGRVLLTLLVTETAAVAAFSPDGKRIVAGGSKGEGKGWLEVYDAATGEKLLALEGETLPVGCAVFSPDGTRIASGDQDSVRIWDAMAGKQMHVFKDRFQDVASVCFSPDGKRVIAGGGRMHFVRGAQGEAVVWEVETGKEVAALKGHRAFVRGVCFSPDGKKAATAAGGIRMSNFGDFDETKLPPGEVRVWDLETGKTERTWRMASPSANSVCVSPDGKRLLATCGDGLLTGEAKVWEISTGEERLSLRGHSGEVRSAWFSGDGTRMLTASRDRTIKEWDAVTP